MTLAAARAARTLARSLLLLQVLVPTTRALAQGVAPVRLQEQLDTLQHPVSGVRLVAVLLGGAGDRPADRWTPELYARLPSGAPDGWCVTVRTSGGEYTGRAEYDASGDARGAVLLRFPSAHAAWLARRERAEVPVLVAHARDCARSEAAPLVAPARWGDRPTGDTVTVLAQATGADDMRVALRPPIGSGTCAKLPVARVTHDTACSIRVSGGAPGDTVRVVLTPYSFGTPGAATQLRLLR